MADELTALVSCGNVFVDSCVFVTTLSSYVHFFFCGKSLLFGANSRLIAENQIIFELWNFSL